MVAHRGIVVSLTFFVLLYSPLSLLVAVLWRATKLVRETSPGGLAQVLFWLRVFPLLASALATLIFAVPSFLIFEPRSIDEDIALPLVLGLGCLLLFALGAFRVIAAQRRTARVVADWLNGANALDTGVNTPTFRGDHGAPPLTLVGVCSPRVVVSRATIALLNADELRVAVR